MRVVIDSDKGCVVYPNLCPCCLGVADCTEVLTGSRPVITRTTVSAEMPVCSPCLEHRKVGRDAAVWLALSAFLLMIGFFSINMLAERRHSFEDSALGKGLLVLLMVLTAMVPVAYLWIRRCWRLDHPTHVTAGRAVRIFPTYLGNVAFEFRNAEYGRAFREANLGSLARRE